MEEGKRTTGSPETLAEKMERLKALVSEVSKAEATRENYREISEKLLQAQGLADECRDLAEDIHASQCARKALMNLCEARGYGVEVGERGAGCGSAAVGDPGRGARQRPR